MTIMATKFDSVEFEPAHFPHPAYKPITIRGVSYITLTFNIGDILPPKKLRSGIRGQVTPSTHFVTALVTP